jgi:hypothetical protein
MPRIRIRRQGREKQHVARIRPRNAAKIFRECEALLEGSSDLVRNLRDAGFVELLNRLHDKILQLAIQPDSWGERTRARLISETAAGLKGLPPDAVTTEEIVEIANILMPCFLLELGRRRQHVQVEFPANPCHRSARFSLRVGPSHPVHFINNEQLVQLVSRAGAELVGLCYFGDPRSRERIEANLSL